MPFALFFAESAKADLENIISFLETQGEDGAVRFETVLDTMTTDLCQQLPREIEQIGKPFHAPDEAATLQYSRPVYRERLEMNKRRARRSSSGLWYVYYTLHDRGGNGGPDTVVIIRIRHSAANPFTLESQGEDSE